MRISDWSSDVCSSDLHHGKCISSRHFDAIGTATCQILLEGRYNDILTPDVHYIRFASDFSNISEVMGTFRDERRRLEITEAARAHEIRRASCRERVCQSESLSAVAVT